jgi:hypothetical protein
LIAIVIQQAWVFIGVLVQLKIPGILEHRHPEIPLLQAGAGMDIAGRGFEELFED